ncbi:MAG: response regulator transcription factor [Spirochaetia bacterium]|nr:response regulator transcription factor [Spirochaetia bacterium]
MIRVMLVDDHAIIREGMKVLLAKRQDIVIIGEAGSKKELNVQSAVLNDTDVLVLDMFLETEDAGLHLLEQLQTDHPSLKILIVSMFTSATLVSECLVKGALGYVTKGDAAQYLAQAISAVYENQIFLSPSIVGRVLASQGEEPPMLAMLTNRERDILDLLGKGFTTRRICEHLSISSSTVGTHIENLKYKLNMPDKNSLLRFAIAWVQKMENKKKLFTNK